mmetsp:Transcript_7437/g.15411  ORF Transcript_7437/g.15411 Transcript_7437/m.15411 type:complete len:231 (-) Transcript_7437:1243-1935(-)
MLPLLSISSARKISSISWSERSPPMKVRKLRRVIVPVSSATIPRNSSRNLSRLLLSIENARMSKKNCFSSENLLKFFIPSMTTCFISTSRSKLLHGSTASMTMPPLMPTFDLSISCRDCRRRLLVNLPRLSSGSVRVSTCSGTVRLVTPKEFWLPRRDPTAGIHSVATKSSACAAVQRDSGYFRRESVCPCAQMQTSNEERNTRTHITPTAHISHALTTNSCPHRLTCLV